MLIQPDSPAKKVDPAPQKQVMLDGDAAAAFKRHSAKAHSGFAFSHPEGGTRHTRTMSFRGLSTAVTAFGNDKFDEGKAPPKVAPKKGVRVERLKTSEPRQNGFLGKFYQQKLPSWRLESKSPLFAGILLFVCGAVLAILGTLMCIGLQGKVEYLIQYDGAPVNPMDESATPVRTNWTVGDDVDGLQKGFTRHRNMYYSYQQCTAPPYKPFGIPKTTASRCRIAFYIDHPVPNAVLRYRLDEMYYGDARFYLSFSPLQLKTAHNKESNVDTLDLGEAKLNGEPAADGTCKGALWTGLHGIENGTRGLTVPCGNRVHAMFNDQFQANLFTPEVTASGQGSPSATTKAPGLTSLSLDTDSITTHGDGLITKPRSLEDESGFRSGQTYLHQMQPDVISKEEGMDNPHFKVWMHIEAFPSFQKLYGKFSEQGGFNTGHVVVVDVESRYDVDSFQGRKYLVLAAESVDGPSGWLPVNNIIAPLSFLIPGIIFIVLGALVFVLEFRREVIDVGEPGGELSVRCGCFLCKHGACSR